MERIHSERGDAIKLSVEEFINIIATKLSEEISRAIGSRLEGVNAEEFQREFIAKLRELLINHFTHGIDLEAAEKGRSFDGILRNLKLYYSSTGRKHSAQLAERLCGILSDEFSIISADHITKKYSGR